MKEENMTLREAAQMALEALEYPGPSWPESRKSAAEALRAALAEPEQPVAWVLNRELFWPFEYEVISKYGDNAIPLYTAPTPRKPLIPVVHGSALSPSEEKWYAAGWKAAEAAHGIGEQT